MQRVAGVTLSSPRRTVKLLTAYILKVLNVRNVLKALGSLSFQQGGVLSHMQAKQCLDANFIGRAAVCTMHARLLLQIFPSSGVSSGV